jgi:hypothetical protein
MSLSSDVSGVVTIKGTGTLGLKKKFYLDRNFFFPFIFTAKSYKSDKPFVFTLSADNEMLVQQGRRKARFDCGIPGAGYGMFDGLKKAVSLPIDESIAELIMIAMSCSVNDSAVPELSCIYTLQGEKGLTFYATNQITVFRARKKTKHTFPHHLAFPLNLVQYLKHDRLNEIWMKEKEVVLRFDCGYIWQSLSVKAMKAFPVKNIEDVLTEGKTWTEVFRLPMSKLGAVTTRFSDYLTSMKRQDWQLVLKGAAGDQELMLEVSIPQGTFREKVKIEAPLEVAVFAEWPLDTLLSILTHLAKIKDAVLSVRYGKKTPYLLSAANIQIGVTRKIK